MKHNRYAALLLSFIVVSTTSGCVAPAGTTDTAALETASITDAMISVPSTVRVDLGANETFDVSKQALIDAGAVSSKTDFNIVGFKLTDIHRVDISSDLIASNKAAGVYSDISASLDTVGVGIYFASVTVQNIYGVSADVKFKIYKTAAAPSRVYRISTLDTMKQYFSVFVETMIVSGFLAKTDAYHYMKSDIKFDGDTICKPRLDGSGMIYAYDCFYSKSMPTAGTVTLTDGKNQNLYIGLNFPTAWAVTSDGVTDYLSLGSAVKAGIISANNITMMMDSAFDAKGGKVDPAGSCKSLTNKDGTVYEIDCDATKISSGTVVFSDGKNKTIISFVVQAAAKAMKKI